MDWPNVSHTLISKMKLALIREEAKLINLRFYIKYCYFILKNIYSLYDVVINIYSL